MRTFLLLIATCCCLNAAESGPGESAIAYLQQIRDGVINLDAGQATAISPHILEEKRLAIASRLKRLGESLGKGELKVGREKVEGDLAGVLIWKSEGFDPSQMQVIAMGMVRRDGKWLPAPVPASFENCGISYRPEIRKRVKALESWMHRWKVQDLEQLRDESIAGMRAGIQKHLTRETLAGMKQRQVLDLFLDACNRRNPHEIMGLVGGLSDNLPSDWPVRANSIQTATADLQAPGAWRLLMSPNVVRVIVDIDEENGPLQALIACLDPQAIAGSNSREPRIEVVQLELIQSTDGLWQVEVPQYFWQDQSTRAGESQPQLESELFASFTQGVRRQFSAQPQATVADGRKALIKALQQSNFSQLLQFTDIPDDQNQGLKAILRAAEAWGSLHALTDDQNPASAFLLLDLAMQVDGDDAAILVHAFSARKPDRYDPHALFLKRLKDGWMWSPNPEEQTLESFKEWSDQATMEQFEGWRLNLLSDCPVITKLDRPAPDEAAAKAVVERWIKAIESGDVVSGLEQCARLDFEDSTKVMLRNLGYEVVDALRKEGKASVKHVIQKGPWVAVGIHPRNPQTSAYAMYPVIETEKGPRILLEIDLIASSGRGREFLNRTSLARAAKLGDEAAEPITELFEQHCRKSLPQP